MSNYITAPTFKILSYANTFGELMGITNALVLQNNDLASNNFTKASGTLYLTDPTLALQVNTASIFQGSVQIIGVGSSTYLQKNLTVDGQVYLNYLSTGPTVTIAGQANVNGPILAYGGNTGLIVANTANIGGRLFVSNTASFANAVSIAGLTYISNNAVVTGNTYTQRVQANVSVATVSLTVSGTTSTDILQANTSVNTTTLTVTSTTYTNYLQANSGISTAALNVINTTNTNILQANTSVNTATLTVTGQTYTNVLQANTSVNTSSISATTLTSNSASIGTGGLSVLGNFTINGTTVYNTPTFTISAATPNPALINNPGFAVYRSTANAVIRWNETNKYWDINDVVNGSYYRVHTDEYLSDSVSLVSSSNVASSLAANTLNNNINSANNFLQANIIFGLASAKSYTDSANNFLQANIISGLSSTLSSAKSYTDSANAAIYNYASSGYARANTSVNSIVGTTGVVTTATSGSISLLGSFGVTAVSSGNTITLSTPQDLRTTASPTFAAVSSLYNSIQTTNVGPLLFIRQQGSSYGVTSANAAIVLTSDNTSGNPLLTLQSAGTTNGYLTSLGSMYLNGTYYDGSNNSYYVKPSSITNLYALTVNQTITGNISGNSGTTSQTSWSNLYTTSQLNAQGSQSVTTFLTSTGYLGSIMVQGPGGANSAFMSFHRPGTYASYFGLDSDNNFAVGGWSAGGALGSMKVGSFGVGTAASGTAGEIRATNQITAYYSDENLKTKLGNIDNALSKVMTLNGFYYEPNETAQKLGYTIKKEVGVSAQEVQKVLPEIVVPAPIDDKYLTVHYERLVPLLIEAIKELSAKVEALENK